MADSVFITKDKADFAGLGYERLFKEGLTYVQELSGKQWTDYNVHDPGVTILEQLALALTEIGFKANIDIKDILAEKTADQQDTFYDATQVLNSGAVTLTDLRKIIIDQVRGVRNLWFEQLNTMNFSSELKGLYLVYVEVPPKHLHRIEEVQRDVWKYLDEQSSLCEDIEAVLMLQPKAITLNLDVELSKDENVDNVLADILFSIGEYISSRIRFYTLAELLDEGYSINEIFDGPLLKNGFIKDEDLKPKTRVLYNAEIIKVIQNVKGITNIKSFEIQGYHPDIEGVIIGPHETPHLEADISEHKLSFTKDQVRYAHNPDQVKRLLSEKKALGYRTYTVNMNMGDRNKPEVPQGQKRQLYDYYSIQNTFPALYGIGRYGVPTYFSEAEKARAKQLKAYLLFFEQIMANYLAQLSNVSTLYSLNTDAQASYFTQKLGSVPRIDELLFEKGSSITVGNMEQKAPSLDEINAATDPYLKRRNRLLDHLLARFGEDIEQNSYSRFDQYDSTDSLKSIVEAKTNMLRKLPEIGRAKAKSFNRKENYWGEEYNMSGLEMRIKALLGIPYKKQRLSNIVDEENIYLEYYMDEEGYDGPRYPIIDQQAIDEQFEYIDFSLDEYRNIEEDTQNDCSPEKIEINKELFQSGYTSKNFRVGKDTFYFDDLFYCIAFYNKRSGQWQKVERFYTREKAICALKRLIEYIREANQRSEDFHLVEHILLRPQRKDNRFGFYLKDDLNQINLKSSKTLDFYTFQQEAEEVIESILAGQLKSAEEEGKHYLQVLNRYGQVLAEGQERYDHPMGVNEESERVKAYFAHYSFLDLYINGRLELFIRPLEELDVHTPAYDFNMTIIIPTWSARFSNEEFQKYMKGIIYKETPPHIVIKIVWADVNTIRRFETLYDRWLTLNQDENTENREMNMISFRLLHMLMKLREEHHHSYFEELMLLFGIE